PPKTPKFSVDWYAKGGILNSPTIFGSNGNSLMGGGEAGKEAVLPIDLLRSYIREENQGNNEVLAQMIAEAMSRIPFTVENNIQLGDKKLADVLVDAIIKKMSQSVKWKKGAVGA
ncbi:MAG: phage tail tape measure protein, partial [Dorea longicatena]|nr:phage tail tape measure protein [Dorea longicatena]